MYVRDAEGLRQLVTDVSRSPFVAIDTEFMRERTYYAKLCLVQIATHDVTAIVDPLAFDELDSLWDLLHEERVVKVLHAGLQDLEIVFHRTGRAMQPVFDTQVAATLAGFPQQVGYAAMVQELLGVKLDKSDTFTDWARRPLTGTQIEYALNDVRYLPEVYESLRQRLEKDGRIEWLTPDFKRLEDPSTYDVAPDRTYLRLKRISSLSRRHLGVLQQVTAWREREAQRRDIPRRWVIGDESLMELARRQPRDAAGLESVRGATDRLSKASYAGLLAAVTAGVEMPEEDLPKLPPRRKRAPEIEGAVDLMAAVVRVRAKEHDVAVPLLASRDDLERLAGGERDESPLLQGWRRALVGEELVELLEGRLDLSLAGGALTVRRIGEDAV